MRIRSATIALALSIAITAGCGGGSNGEVDKPSKAETKKAISVAKLLYKVAVAYGSADITKGPCIGNPIPHTGGDWVADVVHQPRKPIDDQPAHQCPLYVEGKVHHFVELDVQGKVIRVK
jgi:hypothetical protein